MRRKEWRKYYYEKNRDNLSVKRKAKRVSVLAAQFIQDWSTLEEDIRALAKELIEKAFDEELRGKERVWFFGCALLDVDPETPEQLAPLWTVEKPSPLPPGKVTRQRTRVNMAAALRVQEREAGEAQVWRANQRNVTRFRALCQAYAHLHPEYAAATYKRLQLDVPDTATPVDAGTGSDAGDTVASGSDNEDFMHAIQVMSRRVAVERG